MDFKKLDLFLSELDEEEKHFKMLLDKNDNRTLEKEVVKIYSSNPSKDNFVISSEKLMTDDENFAIHKHKRYVKFKEHKHDYLELIYVFSGEIKQKINGNEVNIREGDVCLLDLNISHSIEPSSQSDIAVNIIMKAQFFDGIFMSFLSDNDIISDFIIKTFYHKKESNNYLIFHTKENLLIKGVMKRLLSEYFDKKIGSDTAIHAYILLLFTELLRNYRENMGQSTIKNLDRTIIREVQNYLRKNYKTATLKKTAEHFHFNHDYLSKLIKNSTGVSFTDLLQEIKLKEACVLLENTDLPIAEITHTIGYSNLSYFYKIFKKKYKVTPIEYRKRLLSKK